MTDPLVVDAGAGVDCDIKLDVWLRDILSRTPGLVRKVARRELILAIREFYGKSLTWRTVVGPQDMVADTTRYVLSPYSSFANVVAVLSVELEGVKLSPLFRRPAGETREMDRASSYWLESPDTVQLWPSPTLTVEDGLTFYVALAPKLTATLLPRIAQSHHYEPILDGILGRLYAHPAKAYSNPTLAQYHLKRFRNAIGEFAGAAKQGYANAASWQFPRFGK